MKERIGVVEGVRTPIGNVGGILHRLSAVDLGVHVVKEVIARMDLKPEDVDEVILGNVAQPADAANISRVIALQAGLPLSVPAYTVHRNCASGIESITSAMNKISAGHGTVFVVGGTESMSHIPLLYGRYMSEFFYRMMNRRAGFLGKVKNLFSFRPHFLKPVVGVVEELTDPVCGLNVGQTAEVLAQEFSISRREQDAYALRSHQRAVASQKKGFFDEEIHPLVTDPKSGKLVTQDEGPQSQQTLEALAKLKPYFNRRNGTVTLGNACPINDGAAAMVLMPEKLIHQRKLHPLGYIRDYAYAALEPERMGLGPIYATARLFKQMKLRMKDIHLIELNEVFAAQVIANERAFDSDAFAKKYLDRDRAIGAMDPALLNVNGGAIALGHPLGMTGARMVIHLLRELRRRKKQRGLATISVGGGQGAALLLEAD